MKFVILLFAITLSACVPVIIQRYNIEFHDQQGLKAVMYGKRDLDNPVFQFEIPLEYELTRDEYSVHLEVDGVRVFTKALNNAGKLLQLRGDPKYVAQSSTERSCNVFGLSGSTDKLFPTNKVLIFSWSPYRVCFPRDETKVLSFSVLDDKGNVMGTESLPFEVVTREFTWEYDAI